MHKAMMPTTLQVEYARTEKPKHTKQLASFPHPFFPFLPFSEVGAGEGEGKEGERRKGGRKEGGKYIKRGVGGEGEGERKNEYCFGAGILLKGLI